MPTPTPSAITGPLSIGDLLDRTFRALRARFGLLILTAGTVMVPLGLLTALLTGSFLTGYSDLLEFALDTDTSLPPEAILGDFLGYFGGLLVLSLVSALGSTLVTLMAIYHVDRFLHGGASTVGEGWRAGLRRLWPLLLMQLVRGAAIALATFLVFAALGLVLGLVFVVFGLTLGNSVDNDNNVVLVVGAVILILVLYLLGIVLAMTPMAYLSARWIAATPSLLIEGYGPIAALRRSWELTRGRVWRTVGFVVLLTIFSVIVFSLPLSLVQQMALIVMPAQMLPIVLLSTMAGYLTNILYQPFFATGMVMLYYDLRVRAEAYDLSLRVAALEQTLAPATFPESAQESAQEPPHAPSA